MSLGCLWDQITWLEVRTVLGSSERLLSTHLPLDFYVVVSPLDIQLGEVLCLGFRHLVEDIRDQGKGVRVLHSRHIELMIILDEAEAFIFLLDGEDRGCHWKLGWAYVLAFEVLIEEVIQFILLTLDPGGRPWCWMSESQGQVLWHGPTSSSPGAHQQILCQKHLWTLGRD